VESNLHDPGLRGPFGRVKAFGVLEEAEKGLLHDILGFTVIAQNSTRDAKDDPGISIKEKFESLRIVFGEKSH
jgi:hypothetical protein